MPTNLSNQMSQSPTCVCPLGQLLQSKTKEDSFLRLSLNISNKSGVINTVVQLHHSRVKYLGDHKIVKVLERSRNAANPTMPCALRIASCWAIQSLSMKTIFGRTRPWSTPHGISGFQSEMQLANPEILQMMAANSKSPTNQRTNCIKLIQIVVSPFPAAFDVAFRCFSTKPFYPFHPYY